MPRIRAHARSHAVRAGARTALVTLAALAALATGCATSAPPQQDWLLLTTPHHLILSSIGEPGTRALAAQLESFRAGVAFLAGGQLAQPAARTRVLAFDDRSLSRPFDVRSASGYFLSAPDGGYLVLRQGGDFRRDATLQLRHLYAHALLRAGDGITLPLWFDEGLAQVASTIEVEASRVRIGEPRSDHVQHLLDWTWIQIPTVLGAFTLQEFGARGREMYESQTWAFHHYLRFGQARSDRADAQLAALRTRGTSVEVLEQVFGEPVATLDERLAGYGELGEWKRVELRIALGSAEPVAPVPVPRATAIAELARLAVALGRPAVAQAYLENASAQAPDDARVSSALAALAASEGRLAEADAPLARALAHAPDDPVVQQDAGDCELARARRAATPAERAQALATARRHFERSAALDATRSAPLLRLAASYLLPGEPAEAGLAYSQRATALDPAALEGTWLTAQLLERQGRRQHARRLAVQLETRVHEGRIRDDAAAMLDRLGRRTILE